MKKKLFALSVLSVLAAVSLSSCNSNSSTPSSDKLPFNFEPDYSYISDEVSGKTLNVGAILIGDETEGYTAAHINGIEKAKKTLEAKGAKINISYEKSVSDSDTDKVVSKLESLSAAGNNIVITNSYGHQNAVAPTGSFKTEDYPDIDYLVMTGDIACTTEIDNYHNAFNATYQSRYTAGYVAGLKLQELVDAKKLASNNYDTNGNIKIGYVGAYPYAEVKSGYTAFYLGIKSVVSNVSMQVKYTSSWWNYSGEKEAANDLINNGCVIISQHADSYGTPEACEAAFKEGKVVYNVGYNVSMIEAAPSCSLTSATNNWEVYYTHAFYNKLMGIDIEQNWTGGYEAGAVSLTAINYSCFTASKTEIDTKVTAVATALHNNTKKVFDCSTWTKNGAHLTNYVITDDWSTVKGTQCIEKDGDVYYFDESDSETVRSAPYFDIIIDGVTELN